MNDKKKHDDNDRKKLSDDELEDVAGGAYSHTNSRGQSFAPRSEKQKKESKEPTPDPHHHNES